MQVKTVATNVVKLRHTLARKLGKPLVMFETVSHGGYCYLVYAEGHELLSLFAGGMLLAILTSVVLGAE